MKMHLRSILLAVLLPSAILVAASCADEAPLMPGQSYFLAEVALEPTETVGFEAERGSFALRGLFGGVPGMTLSAHRGEHNVDRQLIILQREGGWHPAVGSYPVIYLHRVPPRPDGTAQHDIIDPSVIGGTYLRHDGQRTEFYGLDAGVVHIHRSERYRIEGTIQAEAFLMCVTESPGDVILEDYGCYHGDKDAREERERAPRIRIEGEFSVPDAGQGLW